MKRAVCVFRDNQDYSRTVTEWLENFRRQTGHEFEILDPDENSNFCQVYDIVEYPTLMVLREDGSLLEMWRGKDMPLVDEVLYYML